MTALPRLLVARRTRRAQAGTAYHRATFGVAQGLAFTPLIVAEAAVFHLLLGGTWVAWVLTALHAYSLIWIWGFAIGARAFPHRIGAPTAVLRNGPMYRVKVPLSSVTTATARTERVAGDHRAMTERDDAVLLAARGRVDVWLEFAEPVLVQRPTREPLPTRRLAIASDNPEQLVGLLLAGAAARPVRADHGYTTGGLAASPTASASAARRPPVPPRRPHRARSGSRPRPRGRPPRRDERCPCRLLPRGRSRAAG